MDFFPPLDQAAIALSLIDFHGRDKAILYPRNSTKLYVV